MRYLCGLMIPVLIIIVAGSAQAQPRTTTIGQKVPIDLKVSMAGEEGKDERYLFRDLRGSIAVFYFWRSNNLRSVEALSQLESLGREFREKGVRILSATADTEEKINKDMADHEFGFFNERLWNGISLYHLLGAYSDPYVVIVGPRSRVLWRGQPDQRMSERITDLVELTNPPLGDEEGLNARLRKASRFFDQRECGRAYTIAKELYDMTDDSHSMHGRAEALMARCDQMGHDLLREAIQKEKDGELEEAARIVAEIAVRFEQPEDDDTDRRRDHGSSSGGNTARDGRQESVQRQAEFEVGRMNGNRELKGLIRDAMKEARGRLLIDQAADLEADDYYLYAKTLYDEVVEKYEDTDAAKEAKKLLQRIRRDPEILKKIAQRRAREEAMLWLDIADRFVGIELYDQAREKYQAIIKDYPDTTAAVRAKQRLSDLPKSSTKQKAVKD